MFIIVDYRIHRDSIKVLEKYGEIILFKTENITYSSISCHPDIFIFQNHQHFVVAPNIPEKYIQFFEKNNIQFEFGHSLVGNFFPKTTFYNAAAGFGNLIYNPKTIDSLVLKQCEALNKITVKQGYTRCNTMIVNEEIVITSNHEIAKKSKKGIYFPPEKIVLEGINHGFIGGCLGLFENKLFVNGSLKHFCSIDSIESELNNANIEIIELNNYDLQDVGSILMVGK